MTSSHRLPLAYHHVDVFSPTPFGGNTLTVFPRSAGLTSAQMLSITQEMRHFESVFLEAIDAPAPGADATRVRARVFDLVEELPFAGHPILGAACVLHALAAGGNEAGRSSRSWDVVLSAKTVRVATELVDDHGGAPRRGGMADRLRATLDQGRAAVLASVADDGARGFAEALSLTTDDLHPGLPLEVISTGLRYLVVPVVRGIERARIARRDFGELLASVGAEYVYLLDVSDPLRPEGRHWTNDGVVEDVATGSGAGCAAAYLARHGLVPMAHDVVLRQGRFTGRPSEIRMRAEGRRDDITRVLVGGDVTLVGRGALDVLPPLEEGR